MHVTLQLVAVVEIVLPDDGVDANEGAAQAPRGLRLERGRLAGGGGRLTGVGEGEIRYRAWASPWENLRRNPTPVH